MEKKNISLFIMVFCLICGFFITTISCKNNVYTEPGIFISKDEVSEKAWEDLLPMLEESLGIKKICIRSYENHKELEKILEAPDRYKILFAEVPVTGEYEFAKYAKNSLLLPVKNIKDENYTPTLFNEIKKLFGNSDNIFSLPFTYNPWIKIYAPDAIIKQNAFTEAVAGVDDKTNFAILAENIMENKISNNDSTVEKALEDLRAKSNDGTYQMNGFTFTKNDALQMVLNGGAKKTLICFADFINMQDNVRDNLSIEYSDKYFLADATTILFPVYEEEKFCNYVNTVIDILVKPDVNFKVAKNRFYLPVNNASPSLDIQSHTLKNTYRYISKCYIPSLNYRDDNHKKELASEIKRHLSTRTQN